ncbi:hypothetical protein [Methylobacterium sp. J-067]|uniref:hypothetical protein n=1 Tax=Methylobacterium sp. J-067 TaxID=2836648 RepID=UPI001FBA94B7|nr:hypothetical protein [Methylobacterium sp. J-067]
MADWPTLEPRCVSAGEAAAYCGLTPGGFRHWVAIGRLPPALPGTRRWDRKAIDYALDQISGLPTIGTPETGEDDLDQWLRKHPEWEAPAKETSLRGPPWRRVPK